MQKKLIAVAVAGLMSGVAFAQTSVTVGGKFDACYMFSSTANTDYTYSATAATTPVSQLGVAQGGKNTEVQRDGCNSTTRVTIGARENIAKGYDIRVDFDIRFGNVHEGKTGLASNDKKAMAFTTPFGTLQWGTANLMSNDYKLAEKPYMVSPKDTEIVKFGVSQLREESLTNRNTSYWSPAFKLGPVQTLVKATYAFGDGRKAGSNDVDGTGAADAYVIGNEGVVMDGLLDWGIDYTRRTPTTSAASNGMGFTHAYINLRPIPGNKNLKLSAQYNTYKGYNRTTGLNVVTVSNNAGAFKEKNTNFVVSYNFNGKAEAGIGISHLNDLGESRNSGRAISIGGSYFLSKSVQVYAGASKTTFERNEVVAGGKYVGSGTNFAGNFNKLDDRTVRVGIMKEF